MLCWSSSKAYMFARGVRVSVKSNISKIIVFILAMATISSSSRTTTTAAA
jgi:hypothetical protein